MLPLPEASSSWALFLDFDGTLVDLAPTPSSIVVPSDLPELLSSLAQALNGSLALISGRPISELDAFLKPVVLAAAGQHGLEQRDYGGKVTQREDHLDDLRKAAALMKTFAKSDPRIVVEEKSLTAALHYRKAPDREADCQKLVQDIGSQFAALQILAGKMVFEARGLGMDKGQAIETFMAKTPFKSRVPVMIGDDTTDEDGFRVVNRMGGVSVKVGEGPTLARNRLKDVADVLNWLKQLRDSFGDISGKS